MMKNILIASLLSLAMLFSGCGSDAEDTLGMQQMLDKKDYQGVINQVGSKNEANLTDTEKVALGAAYMGRSGVGVGDIIESMLSSGDSNTSSDPFATLADGINEKKSPTALNDLKKSAYYYELAVGNCNDANLTTSDQDICMNIGLANTVQAIVAISYLGDVAELAASFDSNDSGDGLAASSCAMQYALDANVTKLLSNGCIGREDINVTFPNSAEYTTFEIKMSDTNNTYDYLLTPPLSGIRQTALTDGYCTDQNFTRYDVNLTERNSIDTTIPDIYPLSITDGYDVYPCPVNEGNVSEEVTAADILVEVLNGGLDSITGASGDDSELATQVEEFKYEILDINASDVTADTNLTITTEDIINYLNGGV